ncbi:MAG: hypothetical protein IMY70_02830, partial [Bacteroidetes bacterium]|nr:hypothetical protein [Bacteroidota bacterium]
MKNIRLLTGIIFLLFTFLVTGQQTWVSFTSDEPQSPEIRIIEQSLSGLQLEIEIPGMYVSQVEANGTVFQQLELLKWQTTSDIGKPELPMINEIIGIPANKKIRVITLETSTVTLENYLIYPFQTPEKDVTGGKSTEFIIDQDFYNKNISYPDINIYVDKPGIWRDVKISGLHLIPFNYNPAQKTLEVITHIKLEIEFHGRDNEVMLNRSKEITNMFFRMYSSSILNFESLGYTKRNRDNSDIKYLIITNTNPLNTIQPLVEWKNRQGFRVEVRIMEPGFNTSEDFKDYISQLYNSDNLEYVLMVGDAYPNGGNTGDPDDVPMYWWQPSGEDGSYSDTWYVCMDGPDDHYADLAIGRLVYDDLAELDLQIQKTLDHYQNPDVSTNWAENSILVAHKENYPSKYTQCKNEIETYNYSLQIPIFEECYGGAGASNQDIIDFVNNTCCGIFNYRGHGSATAFTGWCNFGDFTAAHIAQFTNNDRLFVVFDVCCDNMNIVAFNGDCLCESFMKSPVAAVAINGAIIPSYTIPNHDYDKEMYKAVFDEGIYNIGYVTNFANVVVLNNHGTMGRSNARTYLWLGDAAVEPWTVQPTDLTVTHEPQIFLNLDEFTVTVQGTNGPIEGARVCITNEDMSLYALAFTDASGVAVVQ